MRRMVKSSVVGRAGAAVGGCFFLTHTHNIGKKHAPLPFMPSHTTPHPTKYTHQIDPAQYLINKIDRQFTYGMII